ncbi:uncharacterized protein CEXT_457031 [Caerostris extrusa]|uniref:Ubiquitin-like protease family profile domain-containing protein n=1 Tax=Caerostris extrusa TaxID=172846 RepID=A0AAV4Y7Y2_CAEEX|nr:uncharacterized protein CEXT_457031 [Caerostris extrusa]
MNGNQIHFILSRDSATSPFLKVCNASDKIPFIKEKKYAFVVNSDESSEPGSHWLVFYCENGCIEFFDSFGNPPFMINDFMKSLYVTLLYAGI